MEKQVSESLKSVAAHYDAAAAQYHEQYEKEKLFDTAVEYPANYFRLQLLLNSFVSKGVRRVIKAGVAKGRLWR